MPQTNSHSAADSIEQKLLGILAAQDLGDITQELCDFSLEEQNATAEAQGIQPSASADYIPVLGKSVTYIVACVLFNERDEVLMMQEAKQSCAGKQSFNIYQTPEIVFSLCSFYARQMVSPSWSHGKGRDHL